MPNHTTTKTHRTCLALIAVALIAGLVSLACSNSSPTEPASAQGGAETSAASSTGNAAGAPIPEEPGVEIEKDTNGEDADEAPGPEILVGDPVTWTYVVTNTGNVELSQIVVEDDKVSPVTCPTTSLMVGESMTCTAAGEAVEGQYSNVGMVRAETPESEAVEDEDESHYLGVCVDGTCDEEDSDSEEDVDSDSADESDSDSSEDSDSEEDSDIEDDSDSGEDSDSSGDTETEDPV